MYSKFMMHGQKNIKLPKMLSAAAAVFRLTNCLEAVEVIQHILQVPRV